MEGNLKACPWNLREVGGKSQGIQRYSLSFIKFERQYRPNAKTFNKFETPYRTRAETFSKSERP